MKISYSWLRTQIDPQLPPEALADILTRTGLEVDSHYRIGPNAEDLEGLLVGNVKEVSAHPNADKLLLTRVDVGNGRELPIVCGAPNVEAGQKVIVAPPGTTLQPAEGKPIKIKKAKIRGEASEGMICSAAEIGLGEDHSGIIVLDPAAETGRPVAELFEGEGDHLFDIDITPNRADAISVLGVARDIDAYFQVHEGKALRKRLANAELPKGDEGKLPIELEVEDAEACPRYCGVSISELKVAPSPEWLQERLKSIGATPVNNVVDATNYILYELGQPLHAFDASAIKGNKVIVKKLPAGTEFRTLDEETRKLDGNELMICNGAEEGMCMAGVLGGADSGVGEGSTEIFLESACFDPATIRRGSSKHGISTEASFRFERGVDPNITRYALERAAALILEVAGGRLASEVQDTRPEGFEWKKVPLSYERLSKQVGETIEKEAVLRILRALEMECTEEREDGCTVAVPPYRIDVTREADLLEEILRIHGYDRIQLPERLRASISHTPHEDKGKERRALSDLLAANGFFEISSNSLVHSEKGTEQRDPDADVRILNPISSELDVLRQYMFLSGLPVLAHNIKRKESDLRLFELGKVYWKEGKEFCEEERLALYMSGRREPENWRNSADAVSFFDLKAAVLQVLERTGVLRHLELQDASSSYLREGAAYLVKGKGQPVVEFGELRPEIGKKQDIDQRIFLAEFRLEALFGAMEKEALRYRSLSKHLPVRKDMAFIVDRARRFEELRDLAFQAEKKLLREVDLFDVYEGEKIGKDKKSYAMKFIFHDPERTLEEKDIDGAMERIRKKLEEELGAALRDG